MQRYYFSTTYLISMLFNKCVLLNCSSNVFYLQNNDKHFRYNNNPVEIV